MLASVNDVCEKCPNILLGDKCIQCSIHLIFVQQIFNVGGENVIFELLEQQKNSELINASVLPSRKTFEKLTVLVCQSSINGK